MPLKLTKRKNSPYWYVRGTVKGFETFESTGETSRIAADAYRLNRENELTRKAKGEKTFLDACIAYVQKGGEKTHIEKLAEIMGHMTLTDITQDLLDTHSRQAYPTQSMATVKRCWYDPTVAIMNYAASLGWCPYTKWKKPKVKRPAPKWAEQDWFAAFWPVCDPELLALTTLLPYTGLRITEALSLTWENVNLKERWAYVPVTKTGDHRTVFLPPQVTHKLRKIRQDKGKVFPSIKDKDSANHKIRWAVKRANKRLEAMGKEPIEFMSTHKIGSHTYATWMRRYAGLDHSGLIATGRWKEASSTFIYTHTIASEEARKSALLPRISRAKSVHRGNK